MDKLLKYLNQLETAEQTAFAQRCGTTVGYLRKACSIKQQLSEGMCLRIFAESGGEVQPSDIRPGVDWDYLREALANTAQTATENVAQEASNAS